MFVVAEFWDRYAEGKIVAIGHPNSVRRRAEAIPVGELRWGSPTPEKDGETFLRNGQMWLRVLFYSMAEIEEWRHNHPPVYPGIWNKHEWRRGVSLAAWAAWRDPAETAQYDDHILLYSAPCGPTTTVQNYIAHTALERLRRCLLADIEAGEIALGIPPASPTSTVSLVSDDALFETIQGVEFSRIKTSQAYYRNEWIDLRVYRSDRFTGDRIAMEESHEETQGQHGQDRDSEDPEHEPGAATAQAPRERLGRKSGKTMNRKLVKPKLLTLEEEGRLEIFSVTGNDAARALKEKYAKDYNDYNTRYLADVINVELKDLRKTRGG